MPACGRDVGAKSIHEPEPAVICKGRILRVLGHLRHPQTGYSAAFQSHLNFLGLDKISMNPLD